MAKALLYMILRIQWYDTSAVKKEQNSAICSNMDGPRDYHIRWSKSDRERQVSYGITYMWNLKNNTNESVYKTETLKDIENKVMVTKEKSGVGKDKLGGWD